MAQFLVIGKRVDINPNEEVEVALRAPTKGEFKVIELIFHGLQYCRITDITDTKKNNYILQGSIVNAFNPFMDARVKLIDKGSLKELITLKNGETLFFKIKSFNTIATRGYITLVGVWET